MSPETTTNDKPAADASASSSAASATKSTPRKRPSRSTSRKKASSSSSSSKKTATAKPSAKLKSIPEQRTGRKGEQPLAGRVDNMTRRDDSDVLEGHFCLIDYSGADGTKAAKSVTDTLTEAALQGRKPGVGVADYGVYLQPGELDDDGYPTTAVVMLRDEFAAQVVVPYAALRPAPQGGRR